MAEPDFSPALDDSAIEEAAADYAVTGIARLTSAFSTDAAEALHHHYVEELKWSRVFNEGQRIWDIDPDKIEALETSETGQRLHAAIMASAQKGFQYQHDAVRVSDEANERAERGLMIDRLLDSLNSPAWLDLFRRITGDETAALVDGQATRYLPSQFLTGHDDDIKGKNRIAAYVLGLTPDWRTEWGGLLQFHDENGDVERGLAPRFNTINLFRVPRMHSVSPVSEFAGAPRLSFTGWVRHSG